MVSNLASKRLPTILRDYGESWTSLSGRPAVIARRQAAAYFYGIPSLVALVFVRWHVWLPPVAPFLTASTVFTALLFGLLFLVFNLAVTLRKDKDVFRSAHGLGTVVDDLRATISYTIVVAILLVVALSVASGFLVSSNSKVLGSPQILPWGWTPVLAWLTTHLMLNVFKILERFRTAFNYISR